VNRTAESEASNDVETKTSDNEPGEVLASTSESVGDREDVSEDAIEGSVVNEVEVSGDHGEMEEEIRKESLGAGVEDEALVCEEEDGGPKGGSAVP